MPFVTSSFLFFGLAWPWPLHNSLSKAQPPRVLQEPLNTIAEVRGIRQDVVQGANPRRRQLRNKQRSFD